MLIKKFPEDFSKSDITNIYKLGFIVDVLPNDPNTENSCYFHIATINRKDFCPSPREITDFQDIRDIEPERILPLTRIALNHLEYATNPNKGILLEGLAPYKEFELYKQIQVWNAQEKKFTSMVYAYANKLTF